MNISKIISQLKHLVFSKEETDDLFYKHKLKLISNVLIVFVVMQLMSIIFSAVFSEGELIGFYIYALIINTSLLCLLKKSAKVNVISVIFIIANWLPTPFFIGLYGDPYMTNNLWVVALSLLALFILGKKWRLIAVSYGAINILYSLYVVVKNNGVNMQSYETVDHISGAIDTGFILIITYMIVFQYIKFNEAVNKHVRDKNAMLQNQYKIIEAQNVTKTNLLKEIHHRVKNNLQMVNSMVHMQYRAAQDENSLNTLKKVERRIITMAKLHETIYQSDNFEILDMESYIRELLEDLFKIKTDLDITYKIEVSDYLKLSNDTVLYVGLLITELVINVLKHAFTSNKGQLFISLKELENNRFELKVKDNGKGFDINTLKSTPNSLGQRLISSFSRQLKGEVSVDSNENGSEFTINFSDS
jgi:two-component sensor histidine kinase